MALESEKKHRRIWRIQRRICAVIFAVFMPLTGLAASWDSHQIDDAQDAVQSSQTQNDFWEVVAGNKSAHSVSPANKLASTLHTDLINSAGGTQLPDSITNFRATANQYGGVDSELGFNPFDGTGQSCKVCGGLNAVMLNNLQLIQTGKLDTIINSNSTSAVDTTVNFTPLDIPNVLWFGFVWLSTTTAALVFAVRKDAKHNEYDPALLDWTKDGGSSADPFKLLSKALSPGYFFMVLPLKHKYGKNREKMLQEMGLNEATKELREAYDHLAALPMPTKDDDLQKLLGQKETIRKLLESVDDQLVLRSNQGRLSMASQQTVQRTLNDVDQAIDIYGPAVEARQQAISEVEQQPQVRTR